ncbi:hypothetical protein TWF281_001348 [Arthrobotrys megalospora]
MDQEKVAAGSLRPTNRVQTSISSTAEGHTQMESTRQLQPDASRQGFETASGDPLQFFRMVRVDPGSGRGHGKAITEQEASASSFSQNTMAALAGKALAGSQRVKYGDDDSDSELEFPPLKYKAFPPPDFSNPNEILIDLEEGTSDGLYYDGPAATSSINPANKNILPKIPEAATKLQFPKEYAYYSDDYTGSAASSPVSSSYGSGSAIDNLRAHKKDTLPGDDTAEQIKIEDLIPVAPPIDPKVQEILSGLDTFDVYNFMWQLITDLSLTDPEKRSLVTISPALSDPKIVEIVFELLEAVTLEDVLDGWSYVWELVVAPRLTEDEAAEFHNIKNAYFSGQEGTGGTEGKGKGVIPDHEFSDDNLLYYDDPEFEWPLKIIPAFEKVRAETKERKKAEKAAEKAGKQADNALKLKEIHEMLDSSLPAGPFPYVPQPNDVWFTLDPSDDENERPQPIFINDENFPDPHGKLRAASRARRRRGSIPLEPCTTLLTKGPNANPEPHWEKPSQGAGEDKFKEEVQALLKNKEREKKRQKIKKVEIDDVMEIDSGYEAETDFDAGVTKPIHQGRSLASTTPTIDTWTVTNKNTIEPAENPVIRTGTVYDTLDMSKFYGDPWAPVDSPEYLATLETPAERLAKRAFGYDGTKCQRLPRASAPSPYEPITLGEALRRMAREADHKANCSGDH